MKIAIAGRTMNTMGGVKEYTEGLCYGLSQIKKSELPELFFFMTPSGREPHYSDELKVIKNGKETRLVWDYFTLPRLVKRYGIDVTIHLKNTMPMNMINKPSVVVVHDLMHILQPEVYRWSEAFYTKNMMRFTLSHADKIVTVSNNTRDDFLKALPGIDKEKIVTIHEGVMPRFRKKYSSAEIEDFKKRYNLPNHYLLFTGSLSPRKNLKVLLDAFERIADKIEYDIVITGSKAWKDSAIRRQFANSRIAERVRVLGFIDDNEMPFLYQASDICIYPSLYEGFGIPVLEAFASEVPVIASNASSIPEVAGQAALFFDPQDPEALADAIIRVAQQKEVKDDLIEKGKKQLEQFSWKKAAEKMLTVINSVELKRS